MTATLSLTEQDSKRVADAMIEEIQQTGRVLRREIDTLGTAGCHALDPDKWGTLAYRLAQKGLTIRS